MLRYAVAAATSLVLLTGLTACGGDPPPPRAQPSSTSTSPSSTPTPTPPALPAAAKKHTKAGAEAFVRHYIAVLNFAGTHGDTTALRTLYSRRCSNCEALSDGIDRIYRHGGHISGGGWTVHRIHYYGTAGGETYVDAYVNSAPQVMKSSSAGKLRHFAGAHDRLRAFALVHRHGRWLVSGLDRQI